jgi:hypothetical protein
MSTPPPGHYDDGVQRDSLGQKSRRSFNAGAAHGDASFWTSSQRDGMVRSDSGDPGGYFPGAAEDTFVSTKSRRTHNVNGSKGKASFNSLVPRCEATDAGAERVNLGPQEYDFQHLFACGQPCTPLVSSFKSAIPQGQHVRESSTPGVGDYKPEPVDGLVRSLSKRGYSMFATESAQHPLHEQEPCQTDEVVGPGSYDLDVLSMNRQIKAKANPRLPGFASSQSRSDPTNWV